MLGNYWPVLVVVVTALVCRYHGMSWATGVFLGAIGVVVAPVGYFTGIANLQHRKIAAEVATLSAGAGPDLDVEALREKFKDFLTQHGYTYVNASTDLVVARTADAVSVFASYEFSAAVTPTLHIVVSFRDAPAAKPAS